MPTPNRPLPQNKYPEQYMGNTSFDEDFGVNTVEILEYDPTGASGRLKRSIHPNLPMRLDYDSSSNLIFLGKGKQGAVNGDASWRIQQFTWSGGNLVSITWADGDSEFDNVWNNRASLSYL